MSQQDVTRGQWEGIDYTLKALEEEIKAAEDLEE